MDILGKIVEYKIAEVAERKSLYPVKLLEKSIFFDTKPLSLKKYVTRPDLSGVIAEFKRKSPSLGMINEFVNVEDVTVGYMQAGASALSVLTDNEFFGGSSADLTKARKFNFCPILRKDFVIDEYQIIEAKSIGADAILLIAAILTYERINELSKFAKSLGMEILLEIHDSSEIMKLNDLVDLVGVNNRDLKTFKTDIQTSINMANKIPAGIVKVSESGISQASKIIELKQCGYQGFLIGEHFMKTSRPEKTCLEFIKEIDKAHGQSA